MSENASPEATILWYGRGHLQKQTYHHYNYIFFILNIQTYINWCCQSGWISYLVLQGLHFWWIWSLKVPSGHGLQEPSRNSYSLVHLKVRSQCVFNQVLKCLLTILCGFMTFFALFNTKRTGAVTTEEAFFTATLGVPCGGALLHQYLSSWWSQEMEIGVSNQVYDVILRGSTNVIL